MPGRNKVSGQTDSGRFYNTATELRQASGRAIRLFLYLKKEDKEIGSILMRRQWVHGHINNKARGPKKWERDLEENIETIINRAIAHYRKEEGNNDIELVAVEGWKICNPHIQPRVKDSFKIKAMDRSQDRSVKLEE